MKTYSEFVQPNINQVVLELIRQRLSQRVGQTFLNSLRFQEEKSKYDQILIRQLEYHLFGIHREITRQTKYPKDWWNALKERFFPAWLKKRFPVEYTVVDASIHVNKLCPHLNLAPQDYHTAWVADGKMLESDWQTDKHIPEWIHQTVRLLEIAAYHVEKDSQSLSEELRMRAKQLKEEIL